MNLSLLDRKEKKELLKYLDEQYGITELPYFLVKSGTEKIRAFSGTLSPDELAELSHLARIEAVGLYIIKKDDLGFSISLDGFSLLTPTKNIFELDRGLFTLWMTGNDIETDLPRGHVVMKYGTDFVGCSRCAKEKLQNSVPKERRMRV